MVFFTILTGFFAILTGFLVILMGFNISFLTSEISEQQSCKLFNGMLPATSSWIGHPGGFQRSDILPGVFGFLRTHILC